MQLFPPFCPSCRESLARNGESFTCKKCGRVYPMRGGLVDFLTSLPLSEAQQVIRRAFDALSPSYDNAIVRLVEGLGCPWDDYTARLETFMTGAGGKIILDVGSGTSFPVGPFVPRTSIYVGLDVSAQMLGHAQSLFGDSLNVALWNVDAERIPLPDSCVDLCLALLSFNVFPEPHKAAGEIRRVLKKDGSVFGTVFVQPAPEDLMAERHVEPHFVREVFSVFDPSDWRFNDETRGGILFFTVTRAPSA
jgi:ubiquinone/menaquinone biosynthesis C-methylase UbiE